MPSPFQSRHGHITTTIVGLTSGDRVPISSNNDVASSESSLVKLRSQQRPACENQFQNRECQRGALRCENVIYDAVTSGLVSVLYIFLFDNLGQTMLLNCVLEKRPNECIFRLSQTKKLL